MSNKKGYSFFEGLVITFVFISFLICVAIIAFKVGGGVFDWKKSSPIFFTGFLISCFLAYLSTKNPTQ